MRIIRIANRFLGDTRGTVVIMTAFIVPILLVAMLGATTLMTALGKRQHLQVIAQAACNRAIKPLRMTTMSDATRRARAEALFDELAKDRGLAITSRTVTAGWLESRVTAKATIPVMAGFGKQMAVTIAAVEVCAGIPPYPALGDVILNSNFKTPSGTTVDLPYGGAGPWGVFTPQQVSWDGGTGSGVEIQDWKNGFNFNYAGIENLPAGVTNPYVVELDSGPLPGLSGPPAATCGVKGPPHNSSMYKDFELHTGTYRFSLWYRARVPNNPDNTNRLVVYLEGRQPVSDKAAIITMDNGNANWQYNKHDFVVKSYGLYRIHIVAEGCSDGSGALFNDFKITYIKRPYPEYNDPAPSN